MARFDMMRRLWRIVWRIISRIINRIIRIMIEWIPPIVVIPIVIIRIVIRGAPSYACIETVRVAYAEIEISVASVIIALFCQF